MSRNYSGPKIYFSSQKKKVEKVFWIISGLGINSRKFSPNFFLLPRNSFSGLGFFLDKRNSRPKLFSPAHFFHFLPEKILRLSISRKVLPREKFLGGGYFFQDRPLLAKDRFLDSRNSRIPRFPIPGFPILRSGDLRIWESWESWESENPGILDPRIPRFPEFLDPRIPRSGDLGILGSRNPGILGILDPRNPRSGRSGNPGNPGIPVWNWKKTRFPGIWTFSRSSQESWVSSCPGSKNRWEPRFLARKPFQDRIWHFYPPKWRIWPDSPLEGVKPPKLGQKKVVPLSPFAVQDFKTGAGGRPTLLRSTGLNRRKKWSI